MVEEIIGRFDEVQEEAIGMFTLVVVEPRHCAWAQELVEESAAVFPLAPVFHEYNIPGGMAHT